MSFSSFKKSKLLFENWRGFINEAPLGSVGGIGDEPEEEEGAQAAPAGEAPTERGGGQRTSSITDPMETGLASFIKQVQLKPYQDIILGGLVDFDGNEDDDKFIVKQSTSICRDLRPTQNEVVVHKSLEFSLKSPEHFIKYNSSNGPFNVGPEGNDAIITFGGKFVIDGHHRWSSLYCCNPNAAIHTWNISKEGLDPTDVLKAVQAAIFSKLKKIPSAEGGGINLFTTDKSTILKYVSSVISKDSEAIYKFKSYLEGLKEGPTMAGALGTAIAKPLTERIIWPNIEVLQSESKPISGATEREMMPQADKAGPIVAGGELPAALEPLVVGKINVSKPLRKAAE